jgi:cytochrome c biogenesis protein
MAASLQSRARRVWQTLGSVRTGIVVLIAVVIVSAAGTIILQRPLTDPDDLQRAYSPGLLHVLDRFGLTDVFHAWWFAALLALLSLTIVLASIQRFPSAWRFFSRPYRSTDSHFRAVNPVQTQIPIRDANQILEAAESAFRKAGLKPQRVSAREETSLFAEKNRLSVLAVYIVHASLLLIFIGGIIDAIYGYSGFVALTPGKSANSIELRDGSKKSLPFSVRCDSAGQENYADGSPKRWWSKLAVVDNNRETERKEIVVNDPLVYHGVRFYQASFGPTGQVDKVVVAASATGITGNPKEFSLALNETAELDADTTVRLARFVPDFVVRDNEIYTRSNSPDNPAIELETASKKTGKVAKSWIFPAYANGSQGKDSPYNFEFRDLRMGYFTGLQVSHEPGQWLVWAGCVLMGVGLFVAFYLVHMRFWAVPVVDQNGRLVLWLGGAANKNREVFEERFRNLAGKVEEALQKNPQESRAEEREATLVV